MHVQVELGCPDRNGFVGRERKRRAAKLDRVNPQQQVVHDRIPDNSDLEHITWLQACLLCRLRRKRAHGLADDLCHLALATRVHHHVGDPAHQIFTKSNLRVHHPDGGQHLAARQIGEMSGDGRRPDIEGNTAHGVSVPGPHGDDSCVIMHRNRDFPLTLAQCSLEVLHQAKVAVQVGQPPLELQRFLQTPQIPGRVLHVRLLHLDVINTYNRVQLYVVNLGPLAHDLAVHLAVGWDIDDDITQNLGGATQATPGRQLLHFGRVTPLHIAERRQMLGAGGDTVLGEHALAEQDLAATAQGTPAADRIDVYTQRTGGLQHRSADQKATSPARRGKYNERVISHGGGDGSLGGREWRRRLLRQVALCIS